MPERPHHHHELAFSFAEVMYMVIEKEYQSGERDLDATMKRLKDLSAYSLTHAGILNQREGVELLATGMFFGMSSHLPHRKNQQRLRLLSEETISYQGRSENIEQEIANRKSNTRRQKQSDSTQPLQRRLL